LGFPCTQTLSLVTCGQLWCDCLNFIKNCGFQLFKYLRCRKFVVPVLGKIEKESAVPVISKTLKKPVIMSVMEKSATKTNPTISSLTFSYIAELTSLNILRIDEKVDNWWVSFYLLLILRIGPTLMMQVSLQTFE